MSKENVESLTLIFAKLIQGQWQIPVWLNNLRKEYGLDPLPEYYVCNF